MEHFNYKDECGMHGGYMSNEAHIGTHRRTDTQTHRQTHTDTHMSQTKSQSLVNVQGCM